MVYFWGILSNILAAIICPIALWRGGPVEKLGAAYIAFAWVVSLLIQDHSGHGPGIVPFMFDVVGFVFFAILSERTRRIWAMFAAAFELNSMVSQVVSFTYPEVGIIAYVTSMSVWGGYMLIFALLAGVISHERERRSAKNRLQP